MTYPTAKARIGDRISASRILINPLNLTAPKPADTMTAPVIAPMMAWDELLGIPKYHVSKFQMIAANNAARMTVVPSSNTNGSAIPLVIVCATPVNVRAPMKFIVAASKMALLGVNAFVETDVAIAFAVSWNPLIKSNTSANTTIKITIKNKLSMINPSTYLSVLHDNTLQYASDILTIISNFF